MGNLGAMEITLIILVLVLLFGAKKLPELARGSGRALRIFKAETKGLMDDDEDEQKTEAQREIDARHVDSERVDPLRADQPTHRPHQQPGRDADR